MSLMRRVVCLTDCFAIVSMHCLEIADDAASPMDQIVLHLSHIMLHTKQAGSIVIPEKVCCNLLQLQCCMQQSLAQIPGACPAGIKSKQFLAWRMQLGLIQIPGAYPACM